MSTNHTSSRMSPRTRRTVGAAAATALVAGALLGAGCGGEDTNANTNTGVKPGPPPVLTVSGTLQPVNSDGSKDAKTKSAGQTVSLFTISKQGKPDREIQTSVTGGNGAFFFLKNDSVKPGMSFFIKAKKGEPIKVTIPQKGKITTTLKVCFTCG